MLPGWALGFVRFCWGWHWSVPLKVWQQHVTSLCLHAWADYKPSEVFKDIINTSLCWFRFQPGVARPLSPVRIWASITSRRETALTGKNQVAVTGNWLEYWNLTGATAPPCVCESPEPCSNAGLPCQEENNAAAGGFHCCTPSPTRSGPRSHSPPSLLDVCLLLSWPPGSSTHPQGPPGPQCLRGVKSCPQILRHCKKIKQASSNDPWSVIFFYFITAESGGYKHGISWNIFATRGYSTEWTNRKSF